LEQYEKDSFKGGWDTISYGKARDFNLMLREGSQGRLEHFRIAQGQKHEFELKTFSTKQWLFACYCYKGQISFSVNNQYTAVDEGDLLLVEYNEDLKVLAENKADKEGSLIAAYMEI
jgi:environmental stress-induced protein Ves